MCFEALTDDEAPTDPLSSLLVAELPAALKNGALAAVFVVAMLSAQGSLALATGAILGLGALVLGIALHQTVLVAGVLVRRAISERSVARETPA